VVVDAFDASYQSELIRSLARARRERRLELVVFPGGILGAPALAAPQRNAFLPLALPSLRAALDEVLPAFALRQVFVMTLVLPSHSPPTHRSFGP
jgi:hypothetical protein